MNDTTITANPDAAPEAPKRTFTNPAAFPVLIFEFEKNGSYMRASWLGDLAREQTEGEKAIWDKIFNCVPTDAAGRLLRPHEITAGHATAAPAPAYPPMIRRARPPATPATEAP